MDFDSVLDHAGHFGKFQFFIMVLAGVCQIFGGMHMSANKFLTLKPMFQPHLNQRRCYVSNCDNATTQYLESFVSFTIPNTVDEDGSVSPNPCEQFMTIGSSCNPASFSNTTTVPCQNYIYDHTDFEETVVSKYDIVCKKSWNGASSQSVFMVGVLLGSATFGMVADKFGRKTVILAASTIMLGSSIGTAFVPSFSAFTILRFITAFAVSGLFQTGYIIAVEFVGTSKRLWCANMMQVVFAVGELLLGLVAYLVPNWRKLELYISIPASLMLFYYWLLPESVRWLISKGKHRKAKETVLKAAKWNKKIIPEHLLRQAEYTNLPSQPEPDAEHRQQSSGPLAILKSQQMRWWSFNIFFNWIVNAMVYYGLSLSAKSLSGNVYLNFFVLSAVEIPSYILVSIILSHCGRRWVLCLVMMTGGLACGASIFIPEALGWLSTTLAVIGKSAIAASFAIIYIYSAEIYPTSVRSTGIGLSSMFARIGSIIAPIINELRKVYKPLPMIIFSITTIAAAVLALRLPETHNRQLPETIEEAERTAIGRMNDVLNVPRSRLLSRFGSVAPSHRSAERRLVEEGRRLLASDS